MIEPRFGYSESGLYFALILFGISLDFYYFGYAELTQHSEKLK